MKDLVIKFAGDSGDGIQLIGAMFSSIASKVGYQVFTYPSYPADMRAPKNTKGGVSSFQIHIGEHVSEPGDEYDILVCLNNASYEVFGNELKKTGMLIYDEQYPIECHHLNNWKLPITSQCKKLNCLKARNIFALGCVAYYLGFEEELLQQEIQKKFKNKVDVLGANKLILSKSFDLCNNLHISQYKTVLNAKKTASNDKLELLSGCSAVCNGLIRASKEIDKQLFLASYPITPATDILIELEKRRKEGIIAIQAEDEIAAACMCVGAAFGGSVAVTSTSGPGMCLKSEAINLAVMAEIPMVIIDVQRGGPSTGLPTKTEQSDLNIAMYGRSGDSPLPVIAASSPADCYEKAYMAVKMAVENRTPVILLMDAYIGNGLEMCDLEKKLPKIAPSELWTCPGDENTKVLGGSEVDINTLTITTDGQNHFQRTYDRILKVETICVPDLEFIGDSKDILLVGWGSSKGKIEKIAELYKEKGVDVSYTHMDYISPLPANIEKMLEYYNVFVIEQNAGQLSNILYQQGIKNISINIINGSHIDVNYAKEIIDIYL